MKLNTFNSSDKSTVVAHAPLSVLVKAPCEYTMGIIERCNPTHFMYSHLIDSLCSFSLTQVVPSFTHESPWGSRTLIDLALLADVSNLLSCLTVPPLSSSDHLGVSIVLKCSSSRRSVSTTLRCVWMYHNADFSQVPDIIRQTD